MNKILISIKNLKKSFDEGRIQALRGLSLDIHDGDFLAIMGPSGSGKSTLMNLVGALDSYSEGSIIVEGSELSHFSNINEYRREKIGFIFQLHNLIPTLTALENVEIPMFGMGLSRKQKEQKAKSLLSEVGLSDRLYSLPPKLSGGERQRVAIARAFANDPKILLADEPTGSVDSVTQKSIMELLVKIRKEHNTTIIMVTHEPGVASYADKTIYVKDGLISKI